jgi:protein-S-isoprenylcysteine O-methyltransferase Ste14
MMERADTVVCGLRRNAFLLFLALVFTVGLTFATVEVPYLLDEALQEQVTTPGFDSQVSAASRLKTELFIAHFHLRTIGYVCFAVMLLLIVAGFATRRTGFATAGALAFMLPVFAQFAGVMFFLAGLGLLNVLWLPVLDLSFGLARLGLVVRAPFDALRWLLGQVGVNGYWPIVYFFIGAGLLLFFLGTFAWLSARARREGVAVSWIYRLCRHPQYLGWILWSYGIYLLLLQARYPRRSWGIDASLPWLVSTLVIIGVAMLEELSMRRRHGEAYEAYRRSASFLFPLPAFLERLFALPFRLLFGQDRPQRKGEVAVVIALYLALLMGASFLFYGDGLERTAALFRSRERDQALLSEQVTRARTESNTRQKHFLIRDLAARGEPAVDLLRGLLRDEDPTLRELAAESLYDLAPPRALPDLTRALEDPSENVRYDVLRALAAIGSPESAGPILPLLNDPALHVRMQALSALAGLGAEEMVEAAGEFLTSPEAWIRIGVLEALGTLGSERGLPLVVDRVADPEPAVRREAVVALLRIGSPRARPVLEDARRDEDWEVRIYAAEALKRLPRDD